MQGGGLGRAGGTPCVSAGGCAVLGAWRGRVMFVRVTEELGLCVSGIIACCLEELVAGVCWDRRRGHLIPTSATQAG